MRKLSLDTLAVDSFQTTPVAPAALDAGPTRNCDTRQTACTIGPEREG